MCSARTRTFNRSFEVGPRSSPSEEERPEREETLSPAALLASSGAARLAAMASSVYAPSSTLANTLKASRMGRYPVHRLRVPHQYKGQCVHKTCSKFAK